MDSKEEELDQRRMLDLWAQAPLISREYAAKHTWGGDYTNKELEEGKENVVTGLKRKREEVDQGEVDEDKAGEQSDVRMVVVKGKKAEGGGEKKADPQPAPLSFMASGPPEAGTRRQ